MKRLSVALLTLFPLAGIAHPGHGETGGFTIIHYFTEPIHLLIGLATVAFVVTVLLRLSSKKETKKS